MNCRVIVLILVLLAAAGACLAQGDAQSGPNLERISYSQYGFEIAVPQGSARIPAPPQVAQAARGFTEVFSYNGAAAVILIPRAEEKDRKNLESETDKTAAKMGVAPTSFTTSQGVRFVAASGIITLTKEMLAGMPPSLGLKPGIQARMSIYAAPLPTDTTGILVLVFVGASDRSAQVDSLAQTVLDSITFTGLELGNNSASSQVPKQGTGLLPGQIALKGKVETISAGSNSLTMLADEVAAYGKSAVKLDPARRKVVNYSSLPDGVSAGSRILVIGPNSGAGKPMTAVAIILER